MDTQRGVVDHRELLSEHSGHSQGQAGHGPTPLLGGGGGGASESASDGEEGEGDLILQSHGGGLPLVVVGGPLFPMVSKAGAS